RIPNALVIPRDALMVENGQTYARVEKGGVTEKRAVKFGKMNAVEATVQSGLEAGDVVLRGVAPETRAPVQTASVTTGASVR
ncbi:MAG: hypothetical protein ACRD5L_06625, partial [Bryobacteraceae bacterium]